MAEYDAPATQEPAERPHPALARLAPLVGEWEIHGRALDATEDNIHGRVTIAWLPGGFFLEQRGAMEVKGFAIHSVEILWYDPATDTFPATVYSSMNGAPSHYYWDVRDDVVTHWTAGAKYTGAFSADGATLTGGWRADNPDDARAGANYDAIMIRVK